MRDSKNHCFTLKTTAYGMTQQNGLFSTVIITIELLIFKIYHHDIAL
ncbi:hypothetical protein EZS27_024735 [termite gut metagenome]|uniref:Uncharacterized protein n=1 Tax=termite gut metagenome TaxID=433724 RepID=A0A5J4QZD3_9ZZZZ